jgi:RecA-family ATPase
MATSTEPLATVHAAKLVATTAPIEWLVEGLLLKSGTSILGGAPKAGKSFVALDVCVAVASATVAAAHFQVPAACPVTLFCAEDPSPVLASRLAALARSRQIPLESLQIEVIVEPALLLPDALPRLAATLQRSRPGLLLLDPLIRIHRSDENSAMEMAVILDGLRDLARSAKTAILLVHHARKAAAGSSPGSGLRGSSDLAAFADSNLYLRRFPDTGNLELKIEHRAAACPAPLQLRLCVDDDGSIARFQAQERNSSAVDPSAQRVLALLEHATAPLPASVLRAKLGVRNQTVAAALRTLLTQGRIERRGRDGWAAKLDTNSSGATHARP